MAYANFCKSTRVQQHLESIFKDIPAVTRFAQDTFVAIALTESATKQALFTLEQEVIHMVMLLNKPEEIEVVEDSVKWRNAVQDLEKKFGNQYLLQQSTRGFGRVIDIFTIPSCKEEILTTLQDVLDSEACYEENILIEPTFAKFLRSHKIEELRRIEQLNDRFRVRITVCISEKVGNIFIQGTKEGINGAKSAVDRVFQSVCRDEHRVAAVGAETHFRTDGWATLHGMETRLGATIQLYSQKSAPALGSMRLLLDKQNLKRVVIARASFPKNKRIEIIQGNIVKQTTDAIVNPCNTTLSLGGGVAGAVKKAAGRGIEDECHAIMKKVKGYKLPVGSAHVTGGYALQSKFVIHTVGPRYNGGSYSEENLLRRTMQSVMQRASEKRLQSISIPAVSSGVFGYPLQDCVRVIVETVVKSIREKSCTVTVVEFIDLEDKRVRAFQDELAKHCVVEDLAKPQGLQGRTEAGTFCTAEGAEQRCSQQAAAEKHEDGVVFHICTDSEEKLKTIRSQLDAIGKSLVKKDELKHQQIANLLEQEKKELIQKGTAVGVSISFLDDCAALSGPTKSVEKLTDELQRYLIKKEFEEKEAVEFSKRINWQYAEKDDWMNFPPLVNKAIENSHGVLKSTEHAIAHTDGTRSVICFSKGEQRFSTGNTRKVRRVDKTDGESVALPRNWDAMKPGEQLSLVPIAKGSSEWNTVEREFRKTAENKITQIRRVQNPELYKTYMVKLEQMAARNGKSLAQTERRLWHGTAANTVTSILTHGFNRSYCGKNGTAYGQGVYFAVNASYSVRYAGGGGNIIFARVLTGEYGQGSSQYMVAPYRDRSKLLLYDSVVNNLESPAMFVVFSDNMAFPEYLVNFE